MNSALFVIPHGEDKWRVDYMKLVWPALLAQIQTPGAAIKIHVLNILKELNDLWVANFQGSMMTQEREKVPLPLPTWTSPWLSLCSF